MQDDLEFFDHPILSDKEFAELNIKDGDYQFTCLEATPRIAQSGNRTLNLKHQVFDQNGKSHIKYDTLIATESWSFKVKHYWESVGHPEKYNARNRPDDYTNRSGVLRLVTRLNKKTNQQEQSVVDYILSNQTAKPSLLVDQAEKKPSKNTGIKGTDEDFLDEDVPF